MRARVLMSLFTILLAAALISGATIAYFSSTAELEGTFSTGRVRVDVGTTKLNIPLGPLVGVGDVVTGSFEVVPDCTLLSWYEVRHVFDENDPFWSDPNVELTFSRNERGLLLFDEPFKVDYRFRIKEGDVNHLQDLSVGLKFEIHAEQINYNQPEWLHIVQGGSIQDRIDAAKPGDLILVVSDYEAYGEYLVVDKPLTLKGLSGPSIRQIRDGNAIEINADNVNIEGFRFIKDGPEKHMRILVNGQNVQIVDNEFEARTDVSGGFIQVEPGSDDIFIQNNEFISPNDSRVGMIWVRNDVGDITLLDNTLVGQFSEGIVIREGAGHVLIRNNRIRQHADSILANIKIVGQPRSVNGVFHKYDVESVLGRDNDLELPPDLQW